MEQFKGKVIFLDIWATWCVVKLPLNSPRLSLRRLLISAASFSYGTAARDLYKLIRKYHSIPRLFLNFAVRFSLT